MKIYKYKNAEEYIKAQEEGVYNHPKVPDAINYKWVQYSDIEFIKDNIITPYFSKLNIIPKYGICHGAKSGQENKWFEEITGIDFIGTDIIIETNEEMKLIQWDFHETKDKWKNKFDVIYSNALDHSYDPRLALKQWASSLSPHGICVLEWSKHDAEEYVTHVDPFGASLEEYKTIINSINKNIISIHDHECYDADDLPITKSFIVFNK